MAGDHYIQHILLTNLYLTNAKMGGCLKMLPSLNPSFSLNQALQPLIKILGNLSPWIYLDNRQSRPFCWVHQVSGSIPSSLILLYSLLNTGYIRSQVRFPPPSLYCTLYWTYQVSSSIRPSPIILYCPLWLLRTKTFLISIIIINILYFLIQI